MATVDFTLDELEIRVRKVIRLEVLESEAGLKAEMKQGFEGVEIMELKARAA